MDASIWVREAQECHWGQVALGMSPPHCASGFSVVRLAHQPDVPHGTRQDDVRLLGKC